jgi:hypothetical protein
MILTLADAIWLTSWLSREPTEAKRLIKGDVLLALFLALITYGLWTYPAREGDPEPAPPAPLNYAAIAKLAFIIGCGLFVLGFSGWYDRSEWREIETNRRLMSFGVMGIVGGWIYMRQNGN